MGRVTNKTDPDTGEMTEYTYDELGRQIKSVSTLNGKSQTTTSAYSTVASSIKQHGFKSKSYRDQKDFDLTGYSLSYTQNDDFDSVEDILRRITAHFKKGYIISK